MPSGYWTAWLCSLCCLWNVKKGWWAIGGDISDTKLLHKWRGPSPWQKSNLLREFPKHFTITTWSDNHLNNQMFSDLNTQCKRKFLLFREVASAKCDTKLGAQGNHYSASANEVHLLSSYSSPNTAHNTHVVHPYQRRISCKRHHQTSWTNACYKWHWNPVRKSSCPFKGSCHCEH